MSDHIFSDVGSARGDIELPEKYPRGNVRDHQIQPILVHIRHENIDYKDQGPNSLSLPPASTYRPNSTE